MSRSLDPNTFPWPAPPPEAAQGIGTLVTAMCWADLPVMERLVAIYIADGWLACGETTVVSETSLTALAAHLGVDMDTLMNTMWNLLESGLLANLGWWWAR